jgi:hypothetical protein
MHNHLLGVQSAQHEALTPKASSSNRLVSFPSSKINST